MICVGGGSGCDHSAKMPGCYGIRIDTANAEHLINTVNNLAWPHVAMTTTRTPGAEKTSRNTSIVDPVVRSADLFSQILIQQITSRCTGDRITAFGFSSFTTHNIFLQNGSIEPVKG